MTQTSTAPAAPLHPEQVLVVEPKPGWKMIDLAEVWRYRELLWFLALRDVKVRYKQTVLGAVWAIIQPLFKMAVLWFVFAQMVHIQSEGQNYALFAFCGLLPWQLFAFALQQSGNSLIENERLVTKVYFPRLIVPFAAVCAGLVDFAIGLVVLLVMMACMRVHPTWHIIALPLFVALALVTAMAVGLWLSALTVLYRDFRYTLLFITELWFFATPVAYSSQSVVNVHYRLLLGLNPMAGVVEGFRWALLPVNHGPGMLLIVSTAATCLLLVGGLFYFRRMEKNFADRI